MPGMKSISYFKISCSILAALLISSTGAADPPANSVTVANSHPSSKSKTELAPKGDLSAYIRLEAGTVLFDTGSASAPLLPKFVELGLDQALIDAVVLSHDDPEHFHGLSDVLKATAMKPKVFVPPAAAEAVSTQNPGATVVAVAKPTRVLPDAWLVGPISVEFEGETSFAQALVLDQPDGLVVIIGCANPAVASIVEEVKEVFGHRRIKLVAVGIHLRGSKRNDIKEVSLRMQQMGIKGLALSECTGEPALKIFREEWGDRVVSFDFGDSVRF